MEHIERKIEDLITDDLQEKIDVVYLRNNIIAAKEVNLKESCSSEEEYGGFIDVFNIALEREPAFFLMDDNFQKIAEDVLYSKRIEYMRKGNYNEVINDIITKLNMMRMMPADIKLHKASSYVSWNLATHQVDAGISQQDFYVLLAHDALLIQGLLNGNIDDIEPFYFLSSTNYLATVMPELYQQFPEMIDLTMAKMDELAKAKDIKNFAMRQYAKQAQTYFQKVKTKGE